MQSYSKSNSDFLALFNNALPFIDGAVFDKLSLFHVSILSSTFVHSVAQSHLLVIVILY